MYEIQVFYCLFSHTYPQEGRREKKQTCGSIIQIFQCGMIIIAEFGVYFSLSLSLSLSVFVLSSSSENFTTRVKELEKNR